MKLKRVFAQINAPATAGAINRRQLVARSGPALGGTAIAAVAGSGWLRKEAANKSLDISPKPVPGDEAGVLVQHYGRDWRQWRSDWGIPMAAATLLAILVALGGFYLWRGRVRLIDGRSGATLPRWSLSKRLLHWTTAALFVVLLVTGLSLLFRRTLLIPLIGYRAFADCAQWALWVHTFTGLAFALADER